MLDIKLKLQELLQNNETEILEFKEAKINYDFNKTGKYFSALSNEANLSNKEESWLIFGIKNDKSIVGTKYRTNIDDLNSLKNEIANKISNRLTFKEIYEVEITGKRVILFQIPSAPIGLPVSFNGHYYGRDGESTNALNIEELERIRSQNIESDWSIQICQDATIDDLSTEAIQKARELYATKNPKFVEILSTWNNEIL